MNRIATSRELRCELGENGYRVFVQRWSKEAHLGLYFDLLEKIATRKFGYVLWESEEQQGLQPVPRVALHRGFSS